MLFQQINQSRCRDARPCFSTFEIINKILKDIILRTGIIIVVHKIIMKIIAKNIVKSPFFFHARKLLDNNALDWNFPLSKLEKLMVGCYLILRDYSEGNFPPKLLEEQTTFDGENAYYETLQTLGMSLDELRNGEMRKPFWHGSSCTKYLQNYEIIQASLLKCEIKPPAKLLEVGCGSGWIAEFLATTGFHVLATTLDASLGEMIEQRRNSLIAKKLPHNLQFRSSAMEYIQEKTSDLAPFDAVYVHEALHHAHDWQKAIQEFYKCLRPGGWCFLFNEPNIIHTFTSYRVAKLSNTHEIGINPKILKQQLKEAGFSNIKILRNRNHYYIKPIWIAAQKG